MENKKNYIKPELKSVEFKVELGFAASSLSQGARTIGGYSNSTPTFNDTWSIGDKFRGSLNGNNDDWD